MFWNIEPPIAPDPVKDVQIRTGYQHVYTLNDDEVIVIHPRHPPVVYNFKTRLSKDITDFNA